MVGRHSCHSQTFNIGASKHDIPLADPVSDTSWGYYTVLHKGEAIWLSPACYQMNSFKSVKPHNVASSETKGHCSIYLASKTLQLYLFSCKFLGKQTAWAARRKRKWWACDVGEAKEGLENELWHRWSSAYSPSFLSLHLRHSSFSNPSVASPMSQFILLCHRLFTYITWLAAHGKQLLPFLLVKLCVTGCAIKKERSCKQRPFLFLPAGAYIKLNE